MIKQIAWNTFKNTGDLNTFIEYMQLKNVEENTELNSYNGDIKDEGNSNFTK
ncbi:MAG: YqzL family protein [Lachnospiraceae bacterium]|jgi:hypothetical protein|nr:YqzL family protein [Lachnospiraceae bacterium]